jgi:hypothetical protein
LLLLTLKFPMSTQEQKNHAFVDTIIKEVDKKFTCTDAYANAFFCMLISNDFKKTYRETTEERLPEGLVPLVNSMKEKANTEEGLKCLMSIIDNSRIRSYNSNRNKLLEDFPSIKNFTDAIATSTNQRTKLNEILKPKGLVKLYLILPHEVFESAFSSLGYDDLISHSGRKAIKDYIKSQKNNFMQEKEFAKLIKSMFNLQE